MPDSAKPVILLVEDDPLTREQMADFLREEASVLLAAEDGARGLELYRQASPDIVVTDVLMPVMNGLDMAQRIRESDPAAQIVVLTAFSDLDDFGGEACLPAHYLWKPVDIEKLFRVIRQCSKGIGPAERAVSLQMLP